MSTIDADLREVLENEVAALRARVAELEAAIPRAVYRELMDALRIANEEEGATAGRYAAAQWLRAKAQAQRTANGG